MNMIAFNVYICKLIVTFHGSQEILSRDVEFLKLISGETLPLINQLHLRKDIFLWPNVQSLVQRTGVVDTLNCICSNVIFIHVNRCTYNDKMQLRFSYLNEDY